jgi:uncharacterized membrane protein
MSDATPMRKIDIAAAFRWGYVAFKRKTGVLIGLAAIVFVIYVIQGFGSGPITDLLERTLAKCDDLASAECQAAVNNSMSAILVTLVMSVFFTALAGIAKYGVYRASIGLSKDRLPLLTDMLPEAHFGTYALFAVIYSLATIVGLGLCIVPGLVVILFFQLTPFYILDKGMSVSDALRASASAARANLVPMLILTVFIVGTMLIGSIFFGVLTLVLLPYSLLVTSHVYRQINAEQVY